MLQPCSSARTPVWPSFPFKEFALNEVWLQIGDARARPARLDPSTRVLDGDLAKAEPKRIRYRLLHVAGRLAFCLNGRMV
jgi:hypothetical protein